MWGLSLVVASGGHSSSPCAGLSLSRPLLLWSTGSRRAGSLVVAHVPSCSAARGILPDQGSNPCPLHWQADSQPLRHQGSPVHVFLNQLNWGLIYIKGTHVLVDLIHSLCLLVLHRLRLLTAPPFCRQGLRLKEAIALPCSSVWLWMGRLQSPCCWPLLSTASQVSYTCSSRACVFSRNVLSFHTDKKWL